MKNFSLKFPWIAIFGIGVFLIQADDAMPSKKIENKAPLFEVKTVNGEPLKLADYKGKYVLLDFWATWCGPCVGEIPNLKQVYDEFGKDPRFVMIALSLDQDPSAPRAYAEKNKIKWIEGFLGGGAEISVPEAYGIVGIPEIMLIGPDGSILKKNLRGPEIKKAVSEALRKK